MLCVVMMRCWLYLPSFIYWSQTFIYDLDLAQPTAQQHPAVHWHVSMGTNYSMSLILTQRFENPRHVMSFWLKKKHIVTWCQPVHISTNRPKVQGLLGNFMDFHRLHWKILHFTRQVTPEEWISRSFRCTVGLAKSSRRSRCSSKTVSLASCH